MAKRYGEGVLPFKIVPTPEPLIARSGLVLPYELAKTLKLPQVIDRELPQPGSSQGYKPYQYSPLTKGYWVLKVTLCNA